jgi:hypothetical protein
VRSAWRIAALAAALLAAACGPDCDRYCSKVAQCAAQKTPPDPAVDVPACILGCNESGGDRTHTISCYIDHTCSDIQAGHCSVTGAPPQG